MCRRPFLIPKTKYIMGVEGCQKKGGLNILGLNQFDIFGYNGRRFYYLMNVVLLDNKHLCPN